MPSERTSVSFADPRWLLTNSSQKPQVSSDGAELTLLTEPGTDWWRVPERDSSDGVLYSFAREIGEGPKCVLNLISRNIELSNADGQFDQACIILQLGDRWVKAGQEFESGKLYDSVVSSNTWSDWSIQPHVGEKRFTISFAPGVLRVFLGDRMMREVRAFGLGAKGDEVVSVGVMACSPKGGGVAAIFKGFQVREGARSVHE